MAHATNKSPSIADIATSGLTWVAGLLLQRTGVPAEVSDRPSRRATPQPSAKPASKSRPGADADSPTDVPPKGWWDVLKRTYASFSDHRLLAVAAGVTFYSLLALFPGIAAFVSLYGLFADASTINSHLTAMASLLPGGALEILTGQISRIATKGGGALGLSFAIGLITSLWSSNAGIKALFDALNVVYGKAEARGFVRLNLVSFTFTIGAILFAFIAIAAITVVPIVLQTVGLGDATQWILWAARWPALLLVLIIGLAALYRYGPSRNDAKLRWITPGSAIAAIAWLAFSMIFSWYVANFGSYNETYGTLGAVVGFMTWIWLSVAIVLIGGTINAELEEQTDRPTETAS
jgi:membrane protein